MSTDTLPPPHCADCAPPHTETPAPPPPLASTASAGDPALDPALDQATFVPPSLSDGSTAVPRVAIEFCNRCRWLHRASWVQTELFLTFPSDSPDSPSSSSSSPGLKAITLVPLSTPETGGRFRVWLFRDADGQEKRKTQERSWNGWDLVWDRKVEEGFPELKVLKQRIRNLIAPSQSLGHSDKPSSTSSSSASKSDAPATPTVEATGSVKEKPSEEDMERKPGQLLASDFAPTFRCA
ncbi:hypothetical protein JCM8547_005007 [Rhodosporidiobolus lusitaniae]